MAKISKGDKFLLDPRIEADTLPLGHLELCTLRLMNDQRFPWIVMVPQLPGATEIFLLDQKTQHKLADETSAVSAVLHHITGCDKINIAAFGNMVPQLHVHVIARFKSDPAWPGSAIGVTGGEPYALQKAEFMTAKIREELSLGH